MKNVDQKDYIIIGAIIVIIALVSVFGTYFFVSGANQPEPAVITANNNSTTPEPAQTTQSSSSSGSSSSSSSSTPDHACDSNGDGYCSICGKTSGGSYVDGGSVVTTKTYKGHYLTYDQWNDVANGETP